MKVKRMDLATVLFQKKAVNPAKLADYGFRPAAEGGYSYEKVLPSSGFHLNVTLSAAGEVATQVIDPATGDAYRLHLRDGAAGGFVGQVKTEYEEALTEMAAQCFVPDVFQSALAKELIQYVRDTYGWNIFGKNFLIMPFGAEKTARSGMLPC